jgi:hypothetical protein
MDEVKIAENSVSLNFANDWKDIKIGSEFYGYIKHFSIFNQDISMFDIASSYAGQPSTLFCSDPELVFLY